MAKRFTDTNIWDKPWFRKLPPRLKGAWRFLCDRCDHAGLWDIDIDTLCYYVGEEVTVNELEALLKIQQVGEKYFLSGFIEFQYNCSIEDLNPENKVHLSVIKQLKKYGLYKPLASPIQGACIGAKDKDKEKEKEKDKEKDQEEEKEKEETGELILFEPQLAQPDLSLLWNGNCGSLPKCKELTKKRKDAWKIRWREKPDPDYWQEVISRMANSAFCRGENSMWKATVDFLMQPDTHVKVMEGKYDGNPHQQRRRTFAEDREAAHKELYAKIESGEA